MITRAALLLLMVSGSVAQAASLSAETARLEALDKGGKATGEDKARLAQIYFLTSRCPDVRRLAGESTRALDCACGGKCDPHSRLGKIMRLRALLGRPAPWADRELQSVWKEIARAPEAQHAMLRYIASYPPARANAGLRQLRGELESRLQGLEVRP